MRPIPPAPEVISCCELFDAAIDAIVVASRNLSDDFGHYEAPAEAAVLLNLLVRHTEAIIALARLDLRLLPAAKVLARAAFETSLRIRWLLWPDKPFEREARWLVHLAEEERLWERMAKIVEQSGDDATEFRRNSAAIHDFRTRVISILPSDVTLPPGTPSVEAQLKEQQQGKYYIAYAVLSQYVHGGHAAGGLYRQNLGTAKTYGEDISLRDWGYVLKPAWWSIYHATARFLQVAAKPNTRLGEIELLTKLSEQLDRLCENVA